MQSSSFGNRTGGVQPVGRQVIARAPLGQTQPPTAPQQASRLSTGVIVMFVLWTALVFGAYVFAAWLIDWAAANSAALIATGRDAARLTGGDQSTLAVIEATRNSGLLDTLISAVRFLLAPAAAIVWLIGAAVIWFLPKLGGLVATLLGQVSKR